MRWILAAILSVAMLGAETKGLVGRWDGEATIAGRKVPFTMYFDGSGSSLSAALVVGEGRIRSSAASFDGKTLHVSFSAPDSRLEAVLEDGQLKGVVGGNSFKATAFCTCGFVGEAGPDISGKWVVKENGWKLVLRRVGDDTLATVTRGDGTLGPLLGRHNGAFFELSYFDGVRGAVLEIEQRKDGGLVVTLLEPGSAERRFVATQ